MRSMTRCRTWSACGTRRRAAAAMAVVLVAAAAPAAIEESGRLIASDGAADDAFGASVGIDASVAIVGARFDDQGNAEDIGSAYVYRFDGADWFEEAKLIASDGEAQDLFGAAVDVSGDFAIVGAPYTDDFGDGSGSAYVYLYDGIGWSSEGKLLAADGVGSSEFGFDVAIDGDAAIVGAPLAPLSPLRLVAPGGAYVFRYREPLCGQEARLMPADLAHVEFLGWSVAISGDVAVVGAPGYDVEVQNRELFINAGAAYVFRHDGEQWQEEATLTASDFAEENWFGTSVAISDDVIVVGSADNADPDHGGAAYVFRFNGEQWVQESKLHVPAGGPGFDESTSVTVESDAIVVGPGVIDLGEGPILSADLYHYNGWGWSRVAVLVPSDSGGGAFGRAVTLSGDLAVVGDYLGFGNVASAGAAYVYDLQETAPPCPADFDGDGTVDTDTADLLALLAAWGECPE